MRRQENETKKALLLIHFHSIENNPLDELMLCFAFNIFYCVYGLVCNVLICLIEVF